MNLITLLRRLFCSPTPIPEPGSTLADVMQALRSLTEKVDKMTDLTTQIGSIVATEQADIAALTTQVAANNTFIAGLQTQLAAAIAAGQQQGLTPDQLQAFSDIHTAIAAQTAAIATSDQATGTGTTQG